MYGARRRRSSRSSQVASVPAWAAGGQARVIPLEMGEDMFAVGGDTDKVRVTLFVVLPKVAVMLSHPWMTLLVVNLKVPLVKPAAILTEAGTCRPVLPDFKVTVVSVEIGFWRIAVQLPDAPARMERGLQFREDRTGTTIWSESDALTLLDP